MLRKELMDLLFISISGYFWCNADVTFITYIRPLKLVTDELLGFYEEILPARLLRILFVYNLDAVYNYR
jgi:hypothetical protein